MDSYKNKNPFMEFDQFKLRSYSAKEIEKLSVLRIYQCKTFDALGFPIEGGLYDTALGPFERFEKCSTCGQNSKFCPGHVGHISLEVPVYNPVYFPFMLNLLKGTCVNCHKFMCNTDGPATKLLLAQLRCIELGLTDHAEALANVIREKLSNTESKEDAKDLLEKMANFNLHDIDIAITKLTGKDIKTLKKESGIPSKNAVEFKRTLLKDYMKTYLFRHRVKCPLCKRRNSKFRNDGHRAVLLDFGVGGIFGKKTMKGKGKVKKAEDEEDNSMELDDNGPIEEFLDKMEQEKAITADFLRSDNALQKQLEAIQSGKCTKLIWRGAEAREHFRYVWKHDGEVLAKLFPIFTNVLKDNSCPMDKLFYELLIVPPNKFRPIRVFKGDRFEDPQTVGFRRIMEVNQLITYVKASINESGYTVGDADMRTAIEAKLGKGTLVEKLHRAYLDLQLKVNSLYDSELNKMETRPIPGIRQLLEKKQGLFRMHMMGKRVNFACRSVITPDPYLDVDEIGIPEIFAKKLTFEEIPNLLNLQSLRQAVINGPDKYPGANSVELINGRKEVMHPEDHFADDRRGKSRRLQVPTDSAPTEGLKSQEDKTGIKTVLRHLKKGEMVLMNRQPSLHKPSIMGHRVRILKTQKALRMNYAPCKAYNADFDGDEMNGHFIQNRIGQVEAAELANVGSSYLVPKDGTPILGLIQDHVVSGVLLTVRDTFLDKQEFMQLLLSAFAQTTERIKMPPPAIIYPKKLWTGKQIVTAIVQNSTPDGAQLINLTAKAKTSVNCWKVDGYDAPKLEMSESEVIFSRGALVNGVLDKAHFGATQYGLIHCCFELYGHKVATKILSCFSRCFTTFLQSHGFSLGVADVLVKEESNKQRTKIIKKLRKEGDNVVRKTFGLPDDAPRLKLKHVLASAYNNARRETTDVKMYDFTMKQTIGKLNDKINEACIPDGLIRRFPQNSLQLMIQSGAKGSAVNAIQISCALGQIELEGQRPPLSATGRTLPSFWAFDTTPRAGGFVDQRFLTGINPQELFFHTMAGREGLIDTAVKTSRSGYLQRCIIKHLEGITVKYDGTCRDHDGSVMQFRYGEDGFDVGRATFMNPKQFPFLFDNLDAIRRFTVPKNVCEGALDVAKAEKAYRRVKRRQRKHAELATQNSNGGRVFSSAFIEFSKNFVQDVEFSKQFVGDVDLSTMTMSERSEMIKKAWYALSEEKRMEFEEAAGCNIPDPVDANKKFKHFKTLGALPEKTLDQIEEFCKAKNVDDEKLRRTLYWKGMKALAEPGENVGLLAAQSIGEPSTQMTLNTFHFAGRGDMNVTLGIPRLREILMTSGKNIATPTAEITILDTATEDDIEHLKQTFNRVYLKKCLKCVTVREKLDVGPSDATRIYEIGVEILASRARDPATKHLTRKMILKQMEATFIKNVCRIIMSKIRDAQEFVAIVHRKSKNLTTNRSANGENDEEGQREYAPNDDGASSDEEVVRGAEDANEARLANRHIDDAAEYEGEDVEEEDIQVRDPERNMADTFTVYSDDSEADEENENDESMNDSNVDSREKSKEESDAVRILHVTESGSYVDKYEFDRRHNRWCVYTLKLNLDRYKVDVNSIVESVVDKFIVHQTEKIEKCVIREENKNGKDIKVLQTQGINVEAFYKNAHILDVNTIYSNDITLMASKYGIESCHRSIVKEMNNVFGVYGIDVNPRHLTLVADYMTFTGSIAPFSRTAMASSTSSLQKMTFETTMTFMRETLVHGDTDYLNGPSSRIVTGQLIKGGTGSFQLIQNPDYVLGLGNYTPPIPKKSQKLTFTDSE